MTTVKKVSGTAVSMPIGIILGSLMSSLIALVLAALLTWLTLDGRINEGLLGYLIMAMLLVASFAGTLTAAIKIQRRWLLSCLITGAIFYVFLLASTAILFGGNYHGAGTTGIMILLGTLSSGMLGLRGNKTKARHRRRYRPC